MACGEEGSDARPKLFNRERRTSPSITPAGKEDGDDNSGLFPAGAELESAVADEADRFGYAVLCESPNAPNQPGFDIVAMDPINGTLHIYEAKDGKQHIGISDLSAFLNAWGIPTREQIKRLGEEDAKQYAEQRKEKDLFGRAKSYGVLAYAPKGGLVEQRIQESIDQGNVVYHLRGGREVTFTREVLEKFSSGGDENARGYDVATVLE